MSFRFFPRFSEPSQTQIDPPDFNPTPLLEGFSWDWIEFLYQPQKDLEVRSLYWTPDSGVICGESWINNLTDQNRVVILDLVCTLQSQGTGNRITLEKIKGRPILTGCLGDQHLILFLTGNPNIREDPFPYLQNKLLLSPLCAEKVHWICIKSDTKTAAREILESVLQLDWPGEISRRKVALQSQLEITTGDPGWDFILALSQKQAQLKYRQLTSREDLNTTPGTDITPFQALMLLQSLEPQAPGSVINILDLVFDHSVQYEKKGNITDKDLTPPILAAELLWQIHQSGFNSDIWSSYLPKAAGWLEDWFSPGLDKDVDGIPELVHSRILNVDGSETVDELLSGNRFYPYPYLESPGLSALLYNDLCKFDDLKEISRNSTDYPFLERKGTLLKHLRASWNPDDSEFQTRDSNSHETVAGFIIMENLQPGLNILRADLPQPTRIGVLHNRSVSDQVTGKFIIICHGLDWCGKYRIEELHSANFTWGEGIDWGISESIYSKLDYCILKGYGLKGHISLVAPSTSGKDITQTLPLWAGILPDDQAQDFIDNVLLDADRYWSRYGFSSTPGRVESTVQLSWNLLLGQSLLKLGRRDQVAELIKRWMAALVPAVEPSGSLFPGFKVKTGEGTGQKDDLESLFPVGFFLQVLGIQFFQDTKLTIEGKNPFPWPVKLRYRGLTIMREEDQTVIIRPGKETITLTDHDKFQLDLG